MSQFDFPLEESPSGNTMVLFQFWYKKWHYI